MTVTGCRVHLPIVLLGLILLSALARGDGPPDGGRRRAAAGAPPDGASRAVRYLQVAQGYHMRVWLGSNGTAGQGAFTDFLPPDGIGMEYPIGSRIEHLYGAGLWVGALVDTGAPGATSKVYAVTTAYNWGEAGVEHEMY